MYYFKYVEGHVRFITLQQRTPGQNIKKHVNNF